MISLSGYTALLGQYLRPRTVALAFLLTLILLTVGLQVLSPQLIQQFIDSAIQGGSTSQLVGTAGVLLAVGLMHQLTVVVTRYLGHRIAWAAISDLRTDLFCHVLRLDLAFYSDHTPGSLMERIEGDIGNLARFFSVLTVSVVGQVLLLVSILIALFFADWRLGGVFTLFSFGALVGLYAYRTASTPYWRQEREESSSLSSYVEERLNAATDLRTLGSMAHVMNGYYALRNSLFRTRRRAVVRSAIIFGSARLVLVGGYILGLGLSSALHQAGFISLGTVFLVLLYVQLMIDPLQALVGEFDELQRANASIERVRDLLAVAPSIVGGNLELTEMQNQGQALVAFASVDFSYSVGQEVLHNVSFSATPGRVLAIIGRTGSGKSTIAKLLMRLYDPDSGSIELDSQDLRDYPVHALYNKIGMVTQDVQLLHASVYENLTFFDSSISRESVEHVLNMVGMRAWLNSLPNGLDSLLSPNLGLSAGEAQLLSLSRVFLKNPSVVVLDEASSRVDPVTESILEGAFSQLMNGKTGIVIAHRLSTIRRADDILLIEGGRVLEYGPKSLLEADHQSLYHRLIHANGSVAA